MEELVGHMGSLSDTMCYGLEDKSYSVMKGIIKRDFGVEVKRLYRKNIVYSKNLFDEVNIYGEGKQKGKTIYIVGECKARFGVKNLEKYEKMLNRVKKYLGANVIPLILSYQYHPDVEDKLRKRGIKYYWSYEFIE